MSYTGPSEATPRPMNDRVRRASITRRRATAGHLRAAVTEMKAAMKLSPELVPLFSRLFHDVLETADRMRDEARELEGGK